MNKFQRIGIPFLLFLLITSLIFSKTLTKGLLPIPSDLLVSFYFPWSSGGWEGYQPFTTHKEFIGSDAIRQHLPWLKFSIDEIKRGNLPFWNPYIFAGTPNVANIQNFVFYPMSILFLILPLQFAWSILIVLQILLGQFFMFIYLRKLKISFYPAVLSSMAFVFSTYFLYNLEINIIGQTLIWLPLLLFGLESLFESKKFRFFILSTFCFASIYLAGHPQTAILITIFLLMYVVFRYLSLKKIEVILYSASTFLFGFAISSLIVLPSIYLFTRTPLGGAHPKFDYFLIPFNNFITFFAPDFFGNPANNNFWSTIYGDGTPHIGPIVLFFAIYSLFYIKDKWIKFFATTSFIFLLFSISTPITQLIKTASIPVFSSSNMARNSSIALFALTVISSFGLEKYKNEKKNKTRFITISSIFLLIYLALWIFVFAKFMTVSDSLIKEQFKVSLRNLVIPTATFFTFISMSLFLKEKRKVYFISVLIISFLGFFYLSNKILPFSKQEFFFPKHPIIDFVKNNAGINRFYGQDVSSFGTNFSSYYEIYSPEGYSLLRSKRYAELVAASQTGDFNNSYSRSDTDFPLFENGYRKRIFDLLGVKYFLDKKDLEDKTWNPEPEKFTGDSVKLIWQKGKFKVYERLDVLPRVFISNNYLVINQGEILKKLYAKETNNKTILLEKNPPLDIIQSDEFTSPQIEQYSSDKVVILTNVPKNSLLFISDAYYPRWTAKIDEAETEILIADYAFRAVAVPAGQHKITFEYRPVLFSFGLFLSSAAIVIIGSLSIFFLKRKQF